MTYENAKKRVVLLMTPATYRAGAFLSAARRLNLEVVVGIDLPETIRLSLAREIQKTNP